MKTEEQIDISQLLKESKSLVDLEEKLNAQGNPT